MNGAAGDHPLAMSARAVELCMVRPYELAAREVSGAKTLQTITRSLDDNLHAMAAIRSEREEVRQQALCEARERAGVEWRAKASAWRPPPRFAPRYQAARR